MNSSPDPQDDQLPAPLLEPLIIPEQLIKGIRIQQSVLIADVERTQQRYRQLREQLAQNAAVQASTAIDQRAALTSMRTTELVMPPSLLEALRSAWSRIVESVRRLVATIQSSTRSMLDTVRNIDYGQLIDRLPDIAELHRAWQTEMERQGIEALDDGGFGFASELVEQGVMRRFAFISPSARGAAATNRMLGLIRQPAFRTELREMLLTSETLGHRWPIIVEGLDAHARRQYVLSIPALLGQLVGHVANTWGRLHLYHRHSIAA